MKIKRYFTLLKENKELKRKNVVLKELSKEYVKRVEELLDNIESTAIQNNYNNSTYKSKKIVELVRDFWNDFN